MQIKKRLRLNAYLSLLIVLSIGLVLFQALYRLNNANASALIASEIVTSALERVSLRNDYVRNKSARAKEQWFAKNRRIGELLQSAPVYFRGSEDLKIIGTMRDEQKYFEEIFSMLVANGEKRDGGELSAEVEERLINQLNMKVYEVVILGRALHESSKEARASAMALAGGCVVIALLVIIAAALVNMWTLGRVITDRIHRLRDGAVLIGNGNLEHRLDIAGDDEFADLAVVFNAMTAQLAGSYHDLEVEIEERRQAEERTKASLADKEAMLQEIHHRVKNNLQVISSLVSLQADTLADVRIREELGDVRDRVRSMALVHEKLYQTSDLARLNFADYAASLLQTLWRSHGALAEKVRFNLAVASVFLPIETAVPCGLILNELAGNALKHAFPDNRGGTVTVGLEHDAATGTVCLLVRDDGVGLPEDLDWRQARSLGLRLVQILAGQLQGDVAATTCPGAGFRVTFPLTRFQS